MKELAAVFTDPQNAHFWIFIALLVLVVVLLRAKVPGLAAKALDEAGAKVQAQLDEAHRLRAEAAELLAQIKQRAEATEKAAVALLKTAQEDAVTLRAEAAQRLEQDIVRREAVAVRKIATAEAQAAAEVRAAAAELAAQAAEAMLTARLAAAKTDPLLDQALAGLSRFKPRAN